MSSVRRTLTLRRFPPRQIPGASAVDRCEAEQELRTKVAQLRNVPLPAASQAAMNITKSGWSIRAY
jgi:hypothetical protein